MQDKSNMPQKLSRSNLEIYTDHRPWADPIKKLRNMAGSLQGTVNVQNLNVAAGETLYRDLCMQSTTCAAARSGVTQTVTAPGAEDKRSANTDGPRG